MSLRQTYLEMLLTSAGYDIHDFEDGWLLGRSSWYKSRAAILPTEPAVLALPEKVAMQLNTFENGHFVLIEDAPDGFPMAMALEDDQLLMWLKKSVRLPEEEPKGIKTTDVKSLVNQRRGQDKLRKELMTYWGGQCAVTNVRTPELLMVSHIKPWSLCETPKEKLDLYNALLLNVALDRAFDQGLITFDDDGLLLMSEKWNWDEANVLGIYKNMKLRHIEDEHRWYLQYHRKEIFLHYRYE